MNDTATTPNGDRESNGRFAKGNRVSHGNPFGGRVTALRRLLLEKITEEDIATVIDRLIELADDGNFAAIKLVLAYTIGKPETTSGQTAAFFDTPWYQAGGSDDATPHVDLTEGLDLGVLPDDTLGADWLDLSKPSANGKFSQAGDIEIGSATGATDPPKAARDRKRKRPKGKH